MISYIQIDLEELTKKVLQDLPKEDSLNLEADDVYSNEAQRRLEAFQNRLRIGGQNVPEQAARIPKSGIDFLYGEVKNLANNECITALLVHFACKSIGGSLVFTPLFQPVFLTLEDYDDYSLTDIYQIHSKGKVYYYSETESKFIECQRTDSTDEELEWRDNYRSNHTTIKRVKDIAQPYLPFKPLTDSESQLFPFQLIYSLLKDNNSNEVIFKNCMSEFKKNPRVSFKHSMFLSAPPQMGGSGDFFGKHANRSHLCPPCAMKFGFMSNQS